MSSRQWCRTRETAELLDLGPVTEAPPLNSFFGDVSTRDSQTEATRALIDQQRGRIFLVTHQVNISALTGEFTRSGEVLIIRTGPEDIEVLGSIRNSIFSESGPSPLLFFSERKTPQAEERMDRTSAERALRNALIQSELIASARSCATGAIVDIPSREWPRFQYDTSAETELFIPPARLYEPEEVENLYREVKVLKSDVVRLWSETGSDYRTGELVENTREDRYRKWLLSQPNAQQVVGRFLLEEWKLDIRPMNEGRRYEFVSDFADALEVTPPSEKTIARFIKSAKAWLLVND